VKNMTETQILDKIRQYILDNYPKARQGELQVDDKLLEKGIIDSLGLFTLIEFLEITFGIKVSGSDVTEDKFASIQTLTVFVSELFSKNSQ